MSLLDQITALGLFGAKRLSEPKLIYDQLNPKEFVSIKVHLKFNVFIQEYPFEYVTCKMAAIRLSFNESIWRIGYFQQVRKLMCLCSYLYKLPSLGVMTTAWTNIHDGVIKWKYSPRYWPFVQGIHRSPVNSPHKGQWRGALMFSLICVWINGWVKNREADDLRRQLAHYDVTVMLVHYQVMRPVPSLSGVFEESCELFNQLVNHI